jgi:hypothetical protein
MYHVRYETALEIASTFGWDGFGFGLIIPRGSCITCQKLDDTAFKRGLASHRAKQATRI